MLESLRWCLVAPTSLSNVTALERNEVSVKYRQSYSRISIPGLSERIEDAWLRAVENARLRGKHIPFDQPKLRLADTKQDLGMIRLFVGPTTYKEYIACRSDRALLRWIKEKANDLRVNVLQLLPNVIGNVGLVLTSDSKIICVRRSAQVSTYRGYFDLPGGHPEPSNVEGILYLEGPDVSTKVRDEFFDSVTREVREDLNLDEGVLQEPRLLGILANLKDVMKPDMVFLVKTYLSSEYILNRFLLQRRLPGGEVRYIAAIDPINPGSKVKQSKMTPIMEGALALIQAWGAALGDELQ